MTFIFDEGGGGKPKADEDDGADADGKEVA